MSARMGGGAFDHDAISSVELFYEFPTGSNIVSGPDRVESVNDSTSKGVTATQTTDAQRPRYADGWIDFSASGGYDLEIPKMDDALDFTTDFEVFWRSRHSGAFSGVLSAVLFNNYGFNRGGMYLGIKSATQLAVSVHGGTNYTISGFTGLDGDTVIRLSYEASAKTFTCYQDGVEVNSLVITDAVNGNAGTNPALLGAGVGDIVAFKGELRALAVYSEILSSSDAASVITRMQEI